MQRHVLSVLVENEPGVLSRVAGLFSGRGFNIHSLNVAPSLEEGVSHMTITTDGDSLILEQIMKQLHKIVSVIKVVDFADIPAVAREMIFVKVQAEGPMRGEILRTVEIFRCNVAGSPHNSNRCEKDMETAARVAAANAAAFFKGEKFGGLIRREDYME